MSATQSSYTRLTAMLGSAWPIVSLKSPASDEMAVIENICRMVQPRFQKYGTEIYVYDVALNLRRAFVGDDGLSLLTRNEIAAKAEQASSAAERDIFKKALKQMPEQDVLDIFVESPVTEPLNWLYQTADKTPGIFLFLDFHAYLTPESANFNIGALRFVKSLAARLKRSHRRVVFLSHDWNIPGELEGLVYGLENDIPGFDQLKSLFNFFVEDVKIAAKDGGKKFQNKLTDEQVNYLCREAQLLTAEEFLNALRLNVYGRVISGESKTLAVDESTIEAISDIKADKLTKCGIKLASPANVKPAGLENWERWAKQTGDLYYLDESNNPFNLEPASGALLLGVPGSGKSLAAKSLAHQWGLKVAQFNLGDLMDKYVGESERKLREALEAFNSVGRIVVFMDEIEKMLGDGDLDGGTSKRLVGTLLSWLNDKPAGVFVIATANKLDKILVDYPELIRSGRFDSIFWFDVPSARGRAEILQAHLKRCNVDLTVEALLDAASDSVFDDFVGADLEQCVKNAAKAAYLAQEQTITPERLVEAAAGIRPTARRMKEQLEQQRAWARENALFAAPEELRRNETTQTDNRVKTML